MSDQDEEFVDTDPVDEQEETDGADQLGDAGKKALDAMKAKWQKERDARKALETKLRARDESKEEQPDPEEIRKQARAEAQAEVLRERALDRVEAKAAKLFADPEDARALLASKVDEFVDEGKVDNDAIQEALDDLLKKKPHLAAQGGKRFAGSADGGARKGSKPDQLSRADLKRMTPRQIVTARSEGRLDDLLNSK